MSQRLGTSSRSKKGRVMKGDDEVIAKKIKILKMPWELSTIKVNLFYVCPCKLFYIVVFLFLETNSCVF